MKAAASGAQAALEQAILDHLAAHPQAADTAEGVAQWWLGAQSASATPGDVVQALQNLTSRGQLRRVRLADGTTLYSKDTTQPKH